MFGVSGVGFLVLLAAFALTACAPIAPWERGRLASDCMQIPVDSVETAYFSHVELVREGSSGGTVGGGGGCGCN